MSHPQGVLIMNKRVSSSKLAILFLATAFSITAFAEQPAAVDPNIASSNTNELVKIDVKLGDGDLATAGHDVTVHYTGWLYSETAPGHHGKKFDTSYFLPPKPLKFPLGGGKVIKGLDQGVEGMKVGGKRTLIVTSEMAYGAEGGGKTIPPNAALVFDIELLDVK
jgi:FKBP-type peptidyl-prolyl cis-trans isomerase